MRDVERYYIRGAAHSKNRRDKDIWCPQIFGQFLCSIVKLYVREARGKIFVSIIASISFLPAVPGGTRRKVLLQW